jgi:FdhD protein
MIEKSHTGAISRPYTIISRKGAQSVDGAVINERLACIFVNGRELVTMMCTPCQLDALALGFLANERIIQSLDDVAAVEVRPNQTCVDVWLTQADFEPPRRAILTSGCGGGVTFDDLSQEMPPLESNRRVTPEQLWKLMDELQQAAHLYSQARGVHSSALSDGEKLLLVAEDVGRHNTLDKLRGLAMQQGINLKDGIILTTGRISSEMIAKARRMEVPVVCSRTSPTSLSVGLAEAWGLTLIGYLRRSSMNLYTHPERVPLQGIAHHTGNGRRKDS